MTPPPTPPRTMQSRRKSLADQARDCQDVQRRLKEEAAERRRVATPPAPQSAPSR
jgi:hypothetical protein